MTCVPEIFYMQYFCFCFTNLEKVQNRKCLQLWSGWYFRHTRILIVGILIVSSAYWELLMLLKLINL